MFDAIAFAGSGNRCYWQGGFYEALADRLELPPALCVGVSAGAFACIYSVLGIGPRVRKLVLAACGPQHKNFDIRGWRAGGPLCPVGPMYRDLLDEVLDAAALARLKALTDLHIAVTRRQSLLRRRARRQRAGRAAQADRSGGRPHARAADPALRAHPECARADLCRTVPADRGKTVRRDQSRRDPRRLRPRTQGRRRVCRHFSERRCPLGHALCAMLQRSIGHSISHSRDLCWVRFKNVESPRPLSPGLTGWLTC
jgi:pimeloyl-ACP methyl ester carboxylesterase